MRGHGEILLMLALALSVGYLVYLDWRRQAEIEGIYVELESLKKVRVREPKARTPDA